MKAFVIDAYGGPDILREATVPDPEPGPGELLVQVAAASANPLDLKVRSGALKSLLKAKFPLVLGNDVAGTVVSVGRDVRTFRPGDKVFARTDTLRMGGFAQRIAIGQDAVATAPASLSMVEAASVPLVALTAWQALVECADLKKGQKVLVHAGAGGVGTMAIQLAKHLGAFVATTAGASGADLVRGLGADQVVDYRREDFSQVLKDFDVVLDTQGGEVLDKSFGVLRRGGKVVSLAGPPDGGVAQAMGAGIVLKTILNLLSRGARRKAARAGGTYRFLFMRPEGAQLAKIAALIDQGALRTVIDKTFPFAATPQALAYLEEGHAKGKVVIEVAA